MGVTWVGCLEWRANFTNLYRRARPHSRIEAISFPLELRNSCLSIDNASKSLLVVFSSDCGFPFLLSSIGRGTLMRRVVVRTGA